MPRPRTSGVCSTPGCPADTEPGRAKCPAHQPAPWAGSHSRGFTTAQRARILRRDPVCRCLGCREHGGPCAAPSTEADHVVPLSRGGAHDEGNGQGLCRPCHRHKTFAERVR